MNLLRTATAAALMVLVGGGYLGSYVAALNGTALEWHARVDTPPVRLLATVLLGVAVVLALIPKNAEDDATEDELGDPVVDPAEARA